MTKHEVSVAIIGGSGMERLESATLVDRIRVRNRFGRPSADISILDAGCGPFAFLPRHGTYHQLAPDAVPYRANIHALRDLGVQRIIATCVAGSLTSQIAPGDFVIPDQFVEFTRNRDPQTPGPPKHLPLGEPYCPAMRNLLFDTSTAHHDKVHGDGTVVVTEGPRFATRAENRWYAQQGWHLINMTQYPEAYLAREYGMCYATVASITDYAYGIGDTNRQIGPAASMEPVLKIFRANRRISELIAVHTAARSRTDTQERCYCARPMPPEYYRQGDSDDDRGQRPAGPVSSAAIRRVAPVYLYWR